jgi:long-chain acyl-CoA synthetase
MEFRDAVELVTGPGQPLELVRTVLPGGGMPGSDGPPVEVNAFKNVPPSLRELLGARRTDDVFLVYEDERWTFAQVMETVDALAAQLVDQYGVSKGDRVAIGMRNYPEWVISFAAIVSIGAISVSLNAWWTEDELDYALTDSGSTVLIADAERVVRSRATAARLGIRTIGVRGATGDGVDPWGPPIGTPLPDVTVLPTDDATILYTSGTTGNPKGAVSTHGAIIQSLMAFATRSAVEAARKPAAPDAPAPPTPVFILIVPLFHVTGCVPVMLSCFAGGLRLVIMYKWDPSRALQLIERERVTNFVGVPTQSWDLLEAPDFGQYDTSSLTNIGGGGAPAPPELVRRVESSFQGRPQIGYGMTETNAYGPGNMADDYVTHPTSTGRYVPMLELEVRDPDAHPVAVGELGEIWFKGPHLIRGYWNKPEATASTIVDGWLRSGDLGRVDEEGFVYVVDRVKDMVLRAGENVYCAEVEAAIYEHPAVYEAAVFGVPHERLGEEVAAVVMLRPGQQLDAVELTSFLKARIAGFKVPSKIAFSAEQLPRNASGKMLKRELRSWFEG